MINHFKVINEEHAKNKKIIMRVDFNVPMQNGKIFDDTRIKSIVPGLKILANCAKQIFLLTHFGRPNGIFRPELSVQPLQDYLSRELSQNVSFIPHVDNPSKLIEKVDKEEKICLLDNCRFYPGEEENDLDLAKSYASIADIYVNDAFSCCHRSHASIQSITRFLPSYAGLVLAAEIKALTNSLENPLRPLAALVGGAKISTKLSILENLISKVDKLLLAGAMANTFLAAKQVPVGASLYEPKLIQTANMILNLAKEKNCQIILPIDGVVSKSLRAGGLSETRLNGMVGDDEMILDIGVESLALFKKHIRESKTLLWNGPAGAFEIAPYDKGSKLLGEYIGRRTRTGQLISVAGGGDTVAAVNLAGVGKNISYLSLAGGAFLEWIEGKILPGIEALNTAD